MLMLVAMNEANQEIHNKGKIIQDLLQQIKQDDRVKKVKRVCVSSERYHLLGMSGTSPLYHITKPAIYGWEVKMKK